MFFLEHVQDFINKLVQMRHLEIRTIVDVNFSTKDYSLQDLKLHLVTMGST